MREIDKTLRLPSTRHPSASNGVRSHGFTSSRHEAQFHFPAEGRGGFSEAGDGEQGGRNIEHRTSNAQDRRSKAEATCCGIACGKTIPLKLRGPRMPQPRWYGRAARAPLPPKSPARFHRLDRINFWISSWLPRKKKTSSGGVAMNRKANLWSKPTRHSKIVLVRRRMPMPECPCGRPQFSRTWLIASPIA